MSPISNRALQMEKKDLVKLLQRTKGDFHVILISRHEREFKKHVQAFTKKAERMDKSALLLCVVGFD